MKTNTTPVQLKGLASLLVASLLVVGSGCQSLNSFSSSQTPAAGPAGAGNGGYTVAMHSVKKIKPFRGVLNTDPTQPTTVQTALDSAGASKHFRGMEIELIRKVDGEYQPLRLPVDYVAREKAVKMEQDYALHPGDTINIRAKSNSPIDQILGTLSGATGLK